MKKKEILFIVAQKSVFLNTYLTKTKKKEYGVRQVFLFENIMADEISCAEVKNSFSEKKRGMKEWLPKFIKRVEEDSGDKIKDLIGEYVNKMKDWKKVEKGIEGERVPSFFPVIPVLEIFMRNIESPDNQDTLNIKTYIKESAQKLLKKIQEKN